MINGNVIALKEAAGSYSMKNESVSDKAVSEKSTDRRKAPIKIVLRRLPAAMTWDQLETQLDPIPDYEFAEFIAAKSNGERSFSRAYFAFKEEGDIIQFKERFNGYVFVDNQGGESIGIVELAPNPKIPNDRFEDAKERDSKCGTIENDQEYKKFLSERENPQKLDLLSLEEMLKEIDEKEKMAEKNALQETPLTQFIIKKNEERLKRVEEKRRAREEEKRTRIHYEYEMKEKQEPKDAKKITEYRNSKFEKNNEGPVKEKEKLIKGRTVRFEDQSRSDMIEKENKRCDGERNKFVQSSKEDDDLGINGKDLPLNIARKDYTSKEAKPCDERDEKLEQSEKNKDETISRKDCAAKDETILTKSSSRVSKLIIKRAAVRSVAAKAERNTDVLNKGVEKGAIIDKANNDATKPRRNKDRPERPIYQPSAARRRALAAVSSTATGKSTTVSRDKS